MARKSGLGRGLDALIPQDEPEPSDEGLVEVPVDQIRPNPHQPRAHFDREGLAELAASIREHGLIQPLILSPTGEPGRYNLVAGERRLRAARQVGLKTVPAIIRPLGSRQSLELALIENLQREDLTPMEAANAYQQLAEEFALSHGEIASRVGKSRAAITNTLRLLKLPLVIQQALSKGLIGEGHARALLALPDVEAQTNALQIILTRGFSVRQTEEWVRRNNTRRPASPRPRPAPSPELTAVEDELRQRLQTKVQLVSGRKGGRLIIHYYSEEELDALIERILGD